MRLRPAPRTNRASVVEVADRSQALIGLRGAAHAAGGRAAFGARQPGGEGAAQALEVAPAQGEHVPRLAGIRGEVVEREAPGAEVLHQLEAPIGDAALRALGGPLVARRQWPSQDGGPQAAPLEGGGGPGRTAGAGRARVIAPA